MSANLHPPRPKGALARKIQKEDTGITILTARSALLDFIAIVRISRSRGVRLRPPFAESAVSEVTVLSFLGGMVVESVGKLGGRYGYECGTLRLDMQQDIAKEIKNVFSEVDAGWK